MTTNNPFITPSPDEQAQQMIRALIRIGKELEGIRIELSYIRSRRA